MPSKAQNRTAHVVVARRPGHWRWIGAVMAIVLVLAAIWLTDRHARTDAVKDMHRLVDERESLGKQLQDAQTQILDLEQRNAVLQRAEQVANNAAQSLRDTLDQRQAELASLRSDLEFYQRLLGTGGEQQGLAVHSFDLYPTTSAQVFRFELTLVQNLRKATVVSGRAQIRVLGTRDNVAEELGDEALQLLDDQEQLRFAFKYFQQLEGRIELPAGFLPDSVRVRLSPSGSDGVVSEYDWQPELSAE